jgi:hypothetical protein
MSDFSGGPLGATRGRFWSLAHGEESDNNSDDGSAEEFPEEISIDALAAYCKTPEAEDCLLSPSSLSAVHRRERGAEEDAAKGGGSSTQTRYAGEPWKFDFTVFEVRYQKFATKTRKVHFESPILSLTTFLLDSFDAAEWVVVQLRQRKNRFWRRRGVWPPASPRSDRSALQRYNACDQNSKNSCWAIWARVRFKLIPKNRSMVVWATVSHELILPPIACPNLFGVCSIV